MFIPRGKWGQAGVPHRGWRCTELEDLREADSSEPLAICEMCESAEIRYRHLMTHPHYPGILWCGAICAGHMEGDYKAVAARGREKTLQKANKNKRRWLKGWCTSKKGNPYKNINGYNIVIYLYRLTWGLVVTDLATGTCLKRLHGFRSADAAKLQALAACEALGG